MKPSDAMKIPCITLRQPWASLILERHKTIENRKCSPPRTIQGKRIAIHAGRRYDPDAGDALNAIGHHPSCGLIPRQFVLGAILGTAIVKGVLFHGGCIASFDGPNEFMNCELSDGEIDWWDSSLYGWVFRDIRRLPAPVPAVGHQGIWYWEVPAELERFCIDGKEAAP